MRARVGWVNARTISRLLSGLLCLTYPNSAPAAESLTPSTLAAAGQVSGLDFTESELAMMLRGANDRLTGLKLLRERALPNSLLPALIFDPRPSGFTMPTPGPRVAWQLDRRPQLPRNREDLAFLSLLELASLLRARQLSSEDLTHFSLERLKRYGDALHCVVTLTEERALTEARQADREIRQGNWRGPLHGIPYGVKDLLDVTGVPSTWGVALYTNQVAQADAAVVKRLQAAGAVLVAKLSLGELAMGDVWFGGKTRNPWRPQDGSSGSSAGSASAVAAGLVPFAIGSETLGSIVSPATVCGISGIRPSFGRVSRAGAMMLCFSLDKLGPLARSVEDCALVLDTIQGPDEQDRSTIEAPLSLPRRSRLHNLRVGFLEADFGKSYANRTNDLRSLDALRSLGWKLIPVSLPDHPQGALHALLAAEAAMSFDELTRSNLDDQLVQQSPSSWPNIFRSARLITAVDYLQGTRVRAQLMNDFHRLFQEVDVLVAPTWQGRQLLYANMTGHPCVVVPNGDLTQANRPSLCFLSGLFREGDAIAVAAAYQAATSWHRAIPDLSPLGGPRP